MRHRSGLLTLAVAGAALVAVWYNIAVQNYLAFADTLRTSIDLFRFDLLSALHCHLPANSEDECRTWARLNQLIGYGQKREMIEYTREGKS